MEGILVSAATGAMGSLLEKLGIMLIDKYGLYKNVHDDIKSLKGELKFMHEFLVAMAGGEKPDEQAKLRVDAVREMSYDIEDKIDEFIKLVEREPTSMSNGFMKIYNKFNEKIIEIKTRHDISKDVKDIHNQVKEINKKYKRYMIEESSKRRNEKVDPRLETSRKDASELVGIKGPTDKLVKWLSNKEGELGHPPKVLSIVGYGGSGKTTLAKQVYDELGAKYECRAFMPISRNPNMTLILSSILCRLRGQDYADAGPDLDLIIHRIGEFLKNRRYLIVIDDLWEVETWKILRGALFKNRSDSIIMITTRIHDVAKSCCFQGNLVYKIQPLDVLNSKRLFFNRIYGSEEKCPDNLKEIAEDILKKCGGLPLAIIAISSLLATGKTKEEWHHVRNSIGFAQGKNSDIDAMNYILSLSYLDLPFYLRSCLLYLAMFPEDSVTGRERLVQMWISEGFIHSENGIDLVEQGDRYFYDLVNRSLIQPVDIDGDGKAECCRVHDTILDFLIYKSSEENFHTLLSNRSKLGNRVRRLSLMGNEDQGCVEQLDLSHARSLICFSEGNIFPSLAKSNAMRVLDLRHCYELENHHLKGICRLFQLRYLNIFATNISELPREIGDLKFLETLDASGTKLVELPESVARLQRLARLLVDSKTKFPDGIGKMKNLQDLGCINPSEQSQNFVEELGKLTNLKKLSIILGTRESSSKTSFNEENMILFFSSLRKLERCKLSITRIILWWTQDYTPLIRHAFFPALTSIREISIKRGQFHWISKWLISLDNLEIFVTSEEEVINQKDIEMVGSIPTLLKFMIWSTSPAPINFSSTWGFERLRELFFRVTNYKFVFEAGAMPNLKKLELHFRVHVFKSAAACGGFDFGIHHLSNLDHLEVAIDCSFVNAADLEGLEAAEGALKTMADALPSRPMLEIVRVRVDEMLEDDEDSDEQDDEDF